MHIQRFEIIVGTHFFQVTPRHNDERARELCYSFVRKFVKVDIQGNNKTVTTFAAANKQRSWFRFHFNCLADFDNHLMVNNVPKEEVKVTYLPLPEVPKCEIPIHDFWKVRDYQEPIIEYLTKPVGKYDAPTRSWLEGGARARLVGIQTGKGKAVRTKERVLTLDGWKLAEDIKVGDTLVSWDGAPAAVLGVYPQGKMKTVSVGFCDGRELLVTEDHLWSVYEDGDMERKVVTTVELKAILGRGGQARVDIHKAVSEEAADAYEELTKGFATEARKEAGHFEFKVKTKEEADAAAEKIWAAGHRCRILQVHEDRFIIYVYINKGTFATSTMTVTRVWLGVGEEEMVCFAMDHPDKQFISGQWLVTHNTFCALKAISNLGYKFVIIVLAQYVVKWAGGINKETKKYEPGDLCKTLNIDPKEILEVQGGNAMQALTEMAVTEGSMDPYKCIVISNRTFENYLRIYENYGTEMDAMGYHVTPDELWQKLGIGIRLIDEVHMQFHANFRVDLYTHVMQSISLSATLVNRDEAMSRMYKLGYPSKERFHEGPVDKYISSYGVMYRVNPQWNVKTSNRGMSSYSHTAFEDSILKNKAFLDGYAKMVGDYLQQGYIQNYKPGNKAIVFAASVDLCGKMADRLQARFPDKSVKRYVAEDPYQQNYQEPDIRVTTIGSGGTGHDIPGLTDNHMTTAVDSIQANIQAMGRLRKIEDQDTRFYFYSCEQVRKHLGYHEKKRALMHERAKSYVPLFYGTIGESNWV